MVVFKRERRKKKASISFASGFTKSGLSATAAVGISTGGITSAGALLAGGTIALGVNSIEKVAIAGIEGDKSMKSLSWDILSSTAVDTFSGGWGNGSRKFGEAISPLVQEYGAHVTKNIIGVGYHIGPNLAKDTLKGEVINTTYKTLKKMIYNTITTNSDRVEHEK